MQTQQLQQLVLASLEDTKAKNVVSLDVRPLTSITDCMIICSGTSNRHLQTISERIIENIKLQGLKPVGIEGEQGMSGWILVDLGDVVVHIMMPEIREFYSLEKLWATTERTRRANEN